MNVTFSGHITGRGPVVAIEGSKAEISGVKVGVLVHQGENAWVVRGVESSRDMFTGNVVHVGLLLTPLQGSPKLPSVEGLYL